MGKTPTQTSARERQAEKRRDKSVEPEVIGLKVVNSTVLDRVAVRKVCLMWARLSCAELSRYAKR